MLDVAWPELVVIGAVALVAIGPKDLPKVMRTLGQWAGKARGAAQEIRRNFDQLAYESEVAERLKNQPGAPPSPETESKNRDTPSA